MSMSVETLTQSINIALTDEFLHLVEKGEADVYERVTPELSLHNNFGEAVRVLQERGMVMVADLSGDRPRRFRVTVEDVTGLSGGGNG